MWSFRMFRSRGLGRAAPRVWRRRGRTLGLVALAGAAFLLEGCAAWRDPCGRGCLSGVGAALNPHNWGRAIFHGGKRAACPVGDACEPALGTMPMEVAPPSLPGPMMQTPSDDLPSNLSPANPASGSGGKSGGTDGAANKGLKQSYYEYEADRRGGGPAMARRQSGARPPARPPDAGGVAPEADEDPLAAIPRLSVPAEAEVSVASPPPASTSSTTPKPEADQPAPEVQLPPKSAETAAASLAPGIKSFKVVQPQIAGGSLPTAGGWAWLADRGYLTILDLRETSEVKPEDLATAARHGLRYVSLPISAATLDRATLTRFQKELAQADARPIYFFDTDGARARAIWFAQQVLTQKVDRAVASRDAEELGPRDAALANAVAKLIDANAESDSSASVSSSPAPSHSAAPGAGSVNSTANPAAAAPTR